MHMADVDSCGTTVGHREKYILTPASRLTDLKIIGEGGYCSVYRAHHSDWKTVAYKKLPAQTIDEHARSLLMKEGILHAGLEHKNIVQLFGIVSEPGGYGLVMEFMENGDMEDYLHKNKNMIEWKETLRLIHEVTQGMQYLHDQTPPVIHGDLKIQNVLISDGLTAKVSDFGFSDWKQFSASISRNKVRLGTVTHIPPENWNNPHLRKVETFDVYGFGMLIFEAMTLKRPFEGNSAAICAWVQNGHRPDIGGLLSGNVPGEVEKLVESCWQQDVKKRPSFSDIGRILEDLRAPRELKNTELEFEGEIRISEEQDGLAGLTWFEDKFHVICTNSSRLRIFQDRFSFDELEEEEIELDGIRSPLDMTACPGSRSIFISEWGDSRMRLWKIQLPERKVSTSNIEGGPRGLSTTSSDDLLVVVWHDGRYTLEIYRSSDVKRLKRILLPKEVDDAQHAVQTSQGNFVICHRNRDTPGVYLVSELSEDGKKFLRTFDLRSAHHIESTRWWPCHLAIDGDDNLYIADSMSLYGVDRCRVFRLNSGLTRIQTFLNEREQRIGLPQRLHYVRGRGRLAVGQWSSASDRPACVQLFAFVNMS